MSKPTKETIAKYQKKTYDRIILNIRKNNEYWIDGEKLREYAEKSGLSVTNYVLKCVDFYENSDIK